MKIEKDLMIDDIEMAINKDWGKNQKDQGTIYFKLSDYGYSCEDFDLITDCNKLPFYIDYWEYYEPDSNSYSDTVRLNYNFDLIKV